jgi:folate-binding protein YgfZ
MVPSSSSSVREGYDAARRRVAVIDRNDRGLILLTGNDRASYLQGLLTNDIAAIRPGGGCYAAYLTAQGRMIADLLVYELGDLILVSVIAEVKDTVLARLNQFIFSEDVQLGDVTDTFTGVAVVGPDAAGVVETVLDGASAEALRGLPEHGNMRAQFEGQSAIVLRVTDTGEPGYDVLVDRAQGPALRAALMKAGAVEIDASVAEALRIEAGVPVFHRDMDEETIPLEAGIESRAISLTKGCYVGQEVIIRVLHRGHGRVARKLVGVTLDGEAVPATGAVVHADGREIGHVTSSVRSPALEHPIALAYLHRDFVEAGTRVSIDGLSATVTALPFVDRRARAEP